MSNSAIAIPALTALVASSVGNSSVAAIPLANCFSANYSRYYIVGTGISLGTTASYVYLKLSSSGGTTGTYNTSEVGMPASASGTTFIGANFFGASQHNFTPNSTGQTFTFTNTADIYFRAKILRPQDTVAHRMIISDIIGVVGGGSPTVVHAHVDCLANSSASPPWTGFEIIASAGTISGNVYVYGEA